MKDWRIPNGQNWVSWMITNISNLSQKISQIFWRETIKKTSSWSKEVITTKYRRHSPSPPSGVVSYKRTLKNLEAVFQEGNFKSQKILYFWILENQEKTPTIRKILDRFFAKLFVISLYLYICTRSMCISTNPRVIL